MLVCCNRQSLGEGRNEPGIFLANFLIVSCLHIGVLVYEYSVLVCECSNPLRIKCM
jgi:hypothetical protein